MRIMKMRKLQHSYFNGYQMKAIFDVSDTKIVSRLLTFEYCCVSLVGREGKVSAKTNATFVLPSS